MFQFLQRSSKSITRQQVSSFQPQLETLETREVPTATAIASNGKLTVTGDGGADTITITQVNNTYYQVKGVTLAPKFTAIGYYPAKGVRNIRVALGDGANSLALTAAAGVDPSLPPGGGVIGGVRYIGGINNDTVTFSGNTQVFGGVSITLGAGTNSVSLSGGTQNYFGGVHVGGGTGSDTFTEAGTIRVDNLSLNLKGGTDTVTLVGINNGITVSLGDGNDKITLSKVTVNSGPVAISLGANDDLMTVIGSNFGDAFYTPSFVGRDGTDVLDISGNINTFVRGFSKSGFELVF